MIRFFFIAITTIAMYSCSKDPGMSVEEYIAAHHLMTTELDQGVHIIIHEPGNDIHPNQSNNVTVKYTGKLTNGDVFDKSENATFPLANLILGWRIGLPEIGEGGECTLIIPAEAGYGDISRPGIPANSTLIFEMKLIKVQ